jgi:hypothetical protein
MAENRELPEQDTEITLLKAQGWVANWKKTNGEDLGKKKVDSFLIPKVNLEKVLAQGIDAARAYIGINNEGLQTLMIVGTRKENGIYVDMLPGYGPKATNEGKDGGDVGGGEIYDFTEPSPPGTGDPASPMNQ